MGDTYVISGLVRKRRALNRAIREHEAAIERLRHNAAIIDEVLLMYPEDSRSRRRDANDHGPLSRCILTALRLSETPLSVSELTRRMMIARGIEDREKNRQPNVRKALRRMAARGLVVLDASGDRMRWEIAH